MTPTQRKAMEQALEALEWWCNDLLQGRNAADALRDALAEQPTKPQWPETLSEALYRYGTDFMCHSASRGIDDIEEAGCLMVQASKKLAEQPADQEPAIYPDEAFDMGLEAIPYYTAPQPAIPPGYKLVPTSALQWLFGEVGEFECPVDRYFRGKPAPYWWRSVFRELIESAPEAPQPAKRVPLTDEEVERVCAPLGAAMLSFTEVARAIEKAHGITGETE